MACAEFLSHESRLTTKYQAVPSTGKQRILWGKIRRCALLLVRVIDCLRGHSM